ncbi:MAG TPA: translocation/assembly module TamB domain-containing protein, partial [Sulfuricurvum sp.]|nr:translocation/assembly module TamB domain-containing protein [Sulfuricurvum sp.]
LEPLGMEINRSQGSLSEGFSLHGLHSQTIDIKTLSLDYNLTAILKGKHVVDSVRIDGLRIHLDDFINSDDSPSLPLPNFTLKEVILTNLQLISSYPIELDLHGKDGSFDGENLNFKTLTASARTQYASGALRGVLKNNILAGRGVVYPNASQLDPYIAKFVTLPVSQSVDILELSDTNVRLSTKFKPLKANFDPRISLHSTTVGMDYRYDNNYLDFTALYTLLRDKNRVQTHQKLRYHLNGVTTTAFTGEIQSSDLPLPSNIITGSFRDDSDGVAGRLSMAQTSIVLQSNNYDVYHWSSTTVHKDLRFLPMLPEVLQNSPLTGSARGEYRLKDSTVDGEIHLHHNHADITASLHASGDKIRANGEILFPSNAPSWEKWSMQPPPKLDFSLFHELNKTHLSINGDAISLWGEVIGSRIQGSGNYLGTFFDINGTQENNLSDITVTSLTPSLNKTLSLIPSITLPSSGYYDAEVRTKTHLLYDTQLHIDTDVEIPWYAAVIDSKHNYSGVNSSFSINYNADKIFINQYRIDIADHLVKSSRPSYLHLDPHGNLIIDEVWLFDTLLLQGTIDMGTLATTLNLASPKFTYNGPEGEAQIAVDLHFNRDDNATQKLTGNVTFLNGQITYLPLQQFKVMDDDVIIVQDVVAPSDSTLEIEIKVAAIKPLHYFTKELNIHFIPDLTLWKDPKNTMQILGMVTITDGTVTTSGKKFTLRPSYLYFGGELPINPYLDMTVDHEVDYKKIQIYITHRLDSPIFLFNSDPVMSQNDIMSYILFGASSDKTFNASGGSNVSMRADATNLMLGAGLKGLIGGATKLQIDTMNILTTREGGMGFEVGARLNKDFRILYKNDTISSVLVQYTVNRWLRLDADIHELGQGINAIYVKDFRDFLPHNEINKKVRP